MTEGKKPRTRRPKPLLAAAFFLIWTLTCSEAFLENKAWAKWAEAARLTAFLAAALAAQF